MKKYLFYFQYKVLQIKDLNYLRPKVRKMLAFFGFTVFIKILYFCAS
jgi:hypothetical protein